ncbi:MAG: tetratricopeptide repeat protein [Planctomycetota bacterium]
MADDQHREREGAEAAQGAPARTPAKDESVDWSSWSNLWQVPAIVISAGVIMVGLYVAMHRAPANDFDGAFDQIDRLIAAEDFERAAFQLNDVVEPNLELATELQRARFHATVADWISLSQAAEEVSLEANDRRIVEGYAEAVQLGATLDSARLERWANALVAVGDLDAARSRLAELEGMAADNDAGLEVRRRRNRVLRRLVQFSLRQRDLSFESLMQLLNDYRADPMLAPADELWAVGRQAELRLEAGQTRQAVDHLLVDMRRLEPKLAQSPELNFGELYTLVARGYYDLGNHRYAEHHVQQALPQIPRTDPVRGDALVLLGQIAVAQGRWHDAFEHFDAVVRDYPSTRSALAGLLGRAEVHSVLGEHERSVVDYGKVRDRLAEAGPRRDVTAARVARSLTDRHDAALTMGHLEIALQFIMLAESLFEPGQVPADVFFRIASTSRQVADNLMTEARGGPLDSGFERLPLDAIDPAVRHEANEHYRRAGDYYVHHARLLAGQPKEDESWAESLWLAADSYDLAGYHKLAIIHFNEYAAGRSDADPRRSDVAFRLAQAHHAELDYESAAGYYQQVIDEHPRSHVASRSHVPLARCYLALDRRPEAEQQLSQVLTGQRHLKPDALDYRDALIELGTSYYDNGEHVRAIERLDEAARRYPNDPRIDEIRFRLGDSHRRRAAATARKRDGPTTPPAERQRLEAVRSDHLRTAMQLFAMVCDRDRPLDSPAPGRGRQNVRDACLYRADCAFELGMYVEAVELYDQIASRFPKHHSSMTALIQIVNCYHKLGDLDRARTAHRRALVRLKELPEEAFNAPDSLLDRDAWERWLESMPLEPAVSSAASS